MNIYLLHISIQYLLDISCKITHPWSAYPIDYFTAVQLNTVYVN